MDQENNVSEDKSLVTVNEDMVRQLRENAGEPSATANFQYVNFNGQIGKFFKSTDRKGEDGKRIVDELGDSYKAIIIKIRNRVNIFDPQNKKSEYGSMRSDEFDSMKDRIVVTNQKGEELASGTFKQCQQKIPAIRMEKVLYVIEQDNDEVVPCKISIRGGNMVRFFDYLATFDRKTESSSMFYTVMTCKPDKSDFGSFYAMLLSKGEPVKNLEAVLTKQRQLREYLAISERAKTEQEIEDMVYDNFGGGEAIDSDEIKVEDLPF